MPLDSNTSRSAPPANTGSVFLNRLSDVSLFLLQLERRFDPFMRPAFDAVLRDPLARLATALINWNRPNEGLKIAEEKPIIQIAQPSIDMLESAYSDAFPSLKKYHRKSYRTGPDYRAGYVAGSLVKLPGLV